MKIPTGDSYYNEFFYIRGVLHKGYDHIGIAGTKCGDTWTTYNSSISIMDSPQSCIDIHGNLYGGLKLCKRCFGKQSIQHYKDVEARLLKKKAKSLNERAKELKG